ncbi:flagellar biosynthesis protein FliQ [Ahrensia marina]|uniref:Flagellar biosynthetic protein FliQ n=1 Tax=Ahrensia marina TaxID=1514904 RepID=A0A0N1J6B1_9HYPH|nr:flagellar biosynthesis protein FliQ [Ahrensia marina]KPB00124.1 flagellar biosynthesis protein FliQ [Ahrensia marina]
MTQADVLDLVQFAIWITILVSGPAVIAAMVVGLSIALLQALTQVQEITLTFVPKIIAIFLALALAAPFMGSQTGRLTDVLYSRIATGF